MMLIKILVVNNSVSECLIIKKALMEYNVLIAYDGLKAMRQIDEHKDINLVILDLKIPKIDGFQILSVLKSADKCKKLRTIILTDYDGPDIEIKGLKLDAVDYVRKPIDIDSFKARINIHVELLQIQHLFEQKQYEHDLTYDTIFHQAPIGISISHNIEPLSANMNAYTKINPMFEQITGRTKEELIKLGWEKITHPDDLEEDLKNFKKLKSGEIKSYSMEKRYIKPDGSNVWVHIVVAKLKSSADNQYSHICLVQDITRRKEIEADLLESERSKSVLLSHLPGLAYRCSYDQQWTMQFVSDGCFELTGYLPESLLYNKDISFNDIIAPEYHELLWEKWKDAVNKRQPLKYEYEIITAKGERKWVLEMGQGIYNEQGEVEALEGIILDASDRKEIENNFRYNNEHDKWTGLYNCNYLEIMLKNSSIEEIMKNRAVVDINLSAVHTLTVNYGFNYSQDLMKKIADILSHYCTEKCLLFRTFETHFAFYINDYKDKNELIEFCETVANTLEYILLDERIGGGIGVVELDQDNENDINQLLKKLLIASEKAIDINDRDFGICFYNAEIEMQMIREQNIKRELTKIASDENGGGLFLQYQPILDLKLNRICGLKL